MAIPAWGLALLLLHPSSVSRSELWVSDFGAQLSMRVQLATWEEVFPDLDANSDGALSQVELDVYEERMRAYLAAHYVLRAEGSSSPFEPQLVKVRPFTDSSAKQSLMRDWVDLDLEYRVPVLLKGLLIESSAFALGSPDHMDLLTAHFRGADASHHNLSAATPLAHIGSFLKLDRRSGVARGIQLQKSNFALPAFLLAAFLAGLRTKKLFLIAAILISTQVLAFVPKFGDWGRVVEERGLLRVAGALLVAYVCTQTWLKPAPERRLWIEALLMGLVQALSIASIEWDPRINGSAWSLGAHQFVHAGVILVVAAGLGMLRLWMGSRGADKSEGFARIARLGSGLLALAALLWFSAQF